MNTRDIQLVVDMVAPPYVNSRKVEGAQYVALSRVEYTEYCLGGHISKVTEHELAVAILCDILENMPSNDAFVIWRTYPEYETREDFFTGHKLHEIYTRLAWVTP